MTDTIENEEHLITKEYEGYKKEKVDMINGFLRDVKIRKTKHYKKFSSLKKINGVLKSFVNALNAISVCSMVLTFTPVSPVCLIIALSTTSISAIISAVMSAYEIENKFHSHQTSYLQYVDVHRDLSACMFRNGLSSQDLDNILSELNSRLGLIEDNSLPIKIDSLKN